MTAAREDVERVLQDRFAEGEPLQLSAPESSPLLGVSTSAISPGRAPRHRRSRSRGAVLALWAVVAAGVAGGSTVGALTLVTPSIPRVIVATAVGCVALVLGVVLVAQQFERFVLVLTAVRPLLDGLALGDPNRLLAPATAIGLLFVVSSTAWLMWRWRTAGLSRPSPMVWGILAFLVAAALSCLVSPLPVLSGSAWVRLLSAGLMVLVLEQLAPLTTFRRQLRRAVLAAACFVSAWALVQLVVAPPREQFTEIVRAQGPFLHPNVLAKFLVIALLVLVGSVLARSTRSRLLPALAVVVVSFLLVMTQTRIAWMAAVLATLYLLWRNRRWLVAPIAVAVAALAMVPPITARLVDLTTPEPVAGVPGNSFAWRLQYWVDLLPLWRGSPVNGVGLDMVPTLAGYSLQTHNIWVQALVEMGLVGLAGTVAAAVGIAMTVRTWGRLAPAAPLVVAGTAAALSLAMLTMSFGENLLNETTTLWYFIAALFLSSPAAPSKVPVVATASDPGLAPNVRTAEYDASATAVGGPAEER